MIDSLTIIELQDLLISKNIQNWENKTIEELEIELYTLEYENTQEKNNLLKPVMSLEKIKEQFPLITDEIKEKWKDEEYTIEEEDVEKIFGKSAIKLNINSLMKMKLPAKYYVLTGQSWYYKQYGMSIEKHRELCLDKMIFISYYGDQEDINIRVSDSEQLPEDNKIIKYPQYELYQYNGYFGSGSGCDSIYVFMDNN